MSQPPKLHQTPHGLLPLPPPAIVHNHAPRRKEPVRKRKRPERIAIIIPENQPFEDREQFVNWIYANLEIYMMCRLRVWNILPESSKDVRQKAMLILLRRFKPGFTPGNTPGFVEGVLYNEARHHRRAKGRRLAHEGGAAELLAAAATDPEREFVFAQGWKQLAEWYEQLDDEEKDAFEAIEFDELSLDEAAAQLGRARSTVHNQYHRAWDKLKTLARRSQVCR